jgi:ubiquinone/menaquinone biosynthesis C-methylase UbiE
MKSTSFEKSSNWYISCVGDKGHYFHKNVIMPHLKRLIKLNKKSKVLDLACGSGILLKWINKEIEYKGIDISESLIKSAKKDLSKNQAFIKADITKELSIEEKYFSHAFIILALQNIEDGEMVIKNAAKHLAPNGKFIIVINHPCFRIPRQSSWDIDDEKKLQTRKLNMYMSNLKIPIQVHPSKKSSPITYSFHHPISTYSDWLYKNKFAIEKIDELCSDKKSTGKKAKMENRARSEFPLFMVIVAKKIG